MTEAHRALVAYLRQQVESEAPDVVLSPGHATELARIRQATPSAAVGVARVAGEPAVVPGSRASSGRAGPMPLRDLHAKVSQRAAGLDLAGAARREELKKLYYEAQTCTRCPLSASRRTVVFGAGSVAAPLMVIGEAPGADEDAQGLPFVGRAGKLLDDMLKAIGLSREKDVFIANILKCRPPRNRNPESTEVQQCLPMLRRQIEILQPKVILLLGRTAATTLLERAEGVGALRAGTHEYRGIPVFVTYHPAAMLRDQSYKRPAWEDLKRLSATLKELGSDSSAAT
jgi:uracil-DNA glycosylase family 4